MLRMNPSHTNKGEMKMQKTYRNRKSMIGWTAGVAACAVLAVGLYATSQVGVSDPNQAFQPPGQTAPPTDVAGKVGEISAKQAVNIEGTISEVSKDGKSFKVGDLWVTVTGKTQYGVTGPTAPDPSEQLVDKEFKVGNFVSGYTSGDVSSGKVNAERIYSNFGAKK
jgi:hypothetical protein